MKEVNGSIWHTMSTQRVTPTDFVCVIEISKGSKNKYELDKETGLVTILDYMAVVDCGIPINPALARIQTEGGIVQGIGHTLMEDVRYDHPGSYPAYLHPLSCELRFYSQNLR